jgi:hypothetical protein
MGDEGVSDTVFSVLGAGLLAVMVWAGYAFWISREDPWYIDRVMQWIPLEECFVERQDGIPPRERWDDVIWY